MSPGPISLALSLAAAAALLACDRGSSKPTGSKPDGADPAGAEPAETKPAGTAPASKPPDTPAAPQPALIVLGDSLTAGYGLAADQAYPALLQAESDKADLHLRVVNAGRSGDTTAGGAARVDYYLRPEVAPRGLVIWLGANDILRGLPVEEIEKNLRAILEKARAFDAKLPVFLVQMRAFPNLGKDYGDSFEDIYPRVAKETGAILIPFPMEGVAGDPAMNQPDGIHPTAEGTRKVAAAMWKALSGHLGAD
jgi:acyl-CoA thioesterase-1